MSGNRLILALAAITLIIGAGGQTGSTAQKRIEVSIDAGKSAAPHLAVHCMGSSLFLFMPADNIRGFRPDTIALLKQQRSGMWRSPGGNYRSAFEWRDAIGDPVGCARPTATPRPTTSNCGESGMRCTGRGSSATWR